MFGSFSDVTGCHPILCARRVFCSRGSLTPVAAPNVSPNVFFSRSRRSDSNQGVRNRGLRDVALGPIMETGASDPGYSGGLAACAVVLYLDFL
jgi:hypothetical protein